METNGDYNTDSNQRKLKYFGEVVYVFAFDIAYDMKRQPVTRLLGQPLQNYSIGPSKRSPKQLFFYQPQTATLPVVDKNINGKSVQIRKVVKVFNVGAISIQIRVPFEVEKFEDLVAYHNLRFSESSIEDEAVELAKKVKAELEPYCIGPVPELGQSESYTVFCLFDMPKSGDISDFQAENWLKKKQNKGSRTFN